MSTTLLTPTSFCLLVWRRSETGDRFEKGERQRIFITVGEHSVLPFLYLCAMPDSVLLHMRFILRKRNITVLRDSFSRYYGRHLRVSFNDGLYRRVRQGELSEGQEKVPWGTTLAHCVNRMHHC